MSGLDIEALVEQITKRVTSEVVAALSPAYLDESTYMLALSSEPENWPDWDELGEIEAKATGQPKPSPIPRHEEPPEPPPGNSPLRARSRGIIPTPAVDDEPYEVVPAGGGKGAVQPLSGAGSMGREMGGGFNPDPHMNGDWFVANFRKDVEYQRRQLPAEDRVTKVRI